jgi:8-oxo-dGTP pyrophosphatase MutT (NUDIX family)
MTRRSARSAFAPDAFVFPGGTVDAQDETPAANARTLGLEPERLQREFRATIPAALPTNEAPAGIATGAALSIAALRELFEEAGVLLARAGDGARVGVRQMLEPGVERDRVAVRRGQLTFAEFLQSRDWFADAAALALFSHWITPATEPRRYNTHFFFAAAPADQAATADAFETHDGLWIAPNEALARHREGAFHLVYPTIKHLERLAVFDTVEAAMTYAREKPIATIVPFAAPDEGFEMPPSLENAW